MDTPETLPGPDLGKDGAALADFRDGKLEGHFDGAPVLLVRKGETGPIRAIGAKCTHYGGPLAQGVFDGELVRCPWHHACFRPETGEAVHAPAFDPVAGYSVEIRGDRVYVTGVLTVAAPSVARGPQPDSVVIVGGGAAGFAAAERLRREGYAGPVTMISADGATPYDRPNASKDYLAGNAPEEWMPLRPDDWYRDRRVDVRLKTRVRELVPADRRVALEDGTTLRYGALLLATGASPVLLGVPGASLPHVRPLRTLADSRAIIARAGGSRNAVVVGASFIGLEVAASLIKRKLRVHIVAPESVPMERVLGREVGLFVRRLHEENGVQFHLERTVTEIREDSVTLNDGSRIDADLVVFGVGVRPEVSLAEKAGLRTDRGVLVDAQLRTSAEGIWAAGDIARWPDPLTGRLIRVEHWVVAERQGQTAARNILGKGEPFAAVPFFWSQHYDVALNYVGHAEEWDAVEIAGDLGRRDAMVAYRKDGRVLAVVTVGRDAACLEAELALERDDRDRLNELLKA
jgi:NADPH-dependent 2,4-dienoyl-CoA reductase/sulfur reductase-like enzyme/nitrite reductase/ring-hydroxylating ferredoxin subunit